MHRAFKLRHNLRSKDSMIFRMAISPDGRLLAAPCNEGRVRIWNIEDGSLVATFKEHLGNVICVDWSQDGKWLASGGGNDDRTIRVWPLDTENSLGFINREYLSAVNCITWSPNKPKLISGHCDTHIRILDIEKLGSNMGKSSFLHHEGHSKLVECAAFSQNGAELLTGSWDNTAILWDMCTKSPSRILNHHRGSIKCVAWSLDGERIALGSKDKTISISNSRTCAIEIILEGHTDEILSVSFFDKDRLLGAIAKDGNFIIWRVDNWAVVAQFDNIGKMHHLSNCAFHPNLPCIAVCGHNESEINIWDIDTSLILKESSSQSVTHYINAKAVLLGDSGVGKSGLGIRMAEQEFRPTESTHGAQFWQIPITQHDFAGDGKHSELKAELTLWDLAGQPEYRLVHQLFLDDTDVAFLLFDCSDANDPFRGVPYWAKVLKKHTQQHVIKLLVSARCDVSPVTAPRQQINQTLVEYNLEQHFSTSAKENKGVKTLYQYILSNIPWDKLPKTTTPKLFQIIRTFLLTKKESGEALILLDLITTEVDAQYPEYKEKFAEIDTVISMLQARGFVYRLDHRSDEKMLLLRPELINQYASTIIQTARSHELGIGSVPERDVLTGNLPFTGFERLSGKQEKIVLEATAEMLLRHDLCFREMGFLVFPSQINITKPVPNGSSPRAEVVYKFSGSIDNIYASLVVRLIHTEHFQREGQWKYAVEFSRNNYRLGFSMHQIEEGTGELGIYFDPNISDFDRVIFIHFVTDHLRNKGIDIEEQIKLYCHNCHIEIDNLDAIERRVQDGHVDVPCQYCGTLVIIPRTIEELYQQEPSLIAKQQELIKNAEERSGREVWEFKSDGRQYTTNNNTLIHILHLSDLHLETVDQAEVYKLQLETDLIKELEVNSLKYIVISGDIVNYSTADEYHAAFYMIDGLVKRFGLDSRRVIVVPGNHDLNWDLSEEAYPFTPKRKLPEQLDESRYIPAGQAGGLVRNEELYQCRFANFNTHFYKKIYNGTEYPEDYTEQAIVFQNEEDKILFLALNSNWEIDHYFTDRSSVNMEALSKTLGSINEDQFNDWLKIAVWHHPISGKEAMNNEFLELLTVHGFKICMHGHIHEAIEGFHKYDDNRGIQIIGAGTFGAPKREQVTGIPLQYNLLTYKSDERRIIVQTRKKEKPEGAWSADARWQSKKNPKPNYSLRV